MCFCVQGRQRGRHLPGLGTKTSHRLALATLRSAPPEAARRSSRAALRALRARSASLSSLQAERASRFHLVQSQKHLTDSLSLRSARRRRRRHVAPREPRSPGASRSVRFSCFGCAARGLAPASLGAAGSDTTAPGAARAGAMSTHTFRQCAAPAAVGVPLLEPIDTAREGETVFCLKLSCFEIKLNRAAVRSQSPDDRT